MTNGSTEIVYDVVREGRRACIIVWDYPESGTLGLRISCGQFDGWVVFMDDIQINHGGHWIPLPDRVRITSSARYFLRNARRALGQVYAN